MEDTTHSISESELFIKLFAKIVARQTRSQHRLQQLIQRPRELNSAFDKYLVKMKRKTELDKIMVKKLGERVAFLEKKESSKIAKKQFTGRGQLDMSCVLYNPPNTSPGAGIMKSFLLNQPRDVLSFPTPLYPMDISSMQTKEIDRQIIQYNRSEVQEGGAVGHTVDPTEVEIVVDDCLVEDSEEPVHHHVAHDNVVKKVSFNDVARVIASPDENTVENEGVEQLINDDTNSGAQNIREELKRSNLHCNHHDPCSNQSSQRRQESKNRVIYSTYPQELFDKKVYGHSSRRKDHDQNGEKGHTMHHKNLQFSEPEKIIKTTEDKMNSRDVALLLDKMFNELHPEQAAIVESEEVGQTTSNFERSSKSNNVRSAEIEAIDKRMADCLFKPKTRYCTKFDEWLESQRQEKKKREIEKEIDEEMYQNVVKAREEHFMKDNLLSSMRRQSWLCKGDLNALSGGHQPRRVSVVSAVLQKLRRKSSNCEDATDTLHMHFKGNKKNFHVKKNVRRRMSLRPLPEAPQ